MNSQFKSSYYNFLIPIEEKKLWLIYNSLFGGLFEVSSDTGNFLQSLFSKKEFSITEIPDTYKKDIEKLIECNYIINTEVDESEVLKNNYLRANNEKFNNGEIFAIITPTLQCNLACRYCFQNASEKYLNEQTMTDIVHFLEKQIIEVKKNARSKKLNITWFGGEPTLEINKLSSYSKQLINLCEKHSYSYSATMITNGTKLTENTWKILEECKISHIQVTLDGPAEFHNIRRPYKNDPKEDYQRILSNLSNLPANINLFIRINCDKIVWDNIDKLLDDLESNGIWPQKIKQVNMGLAFITTHENSRYKDKDWRFTYEDFYEIENLFIDKKIKHYNLWALTNDKKTAKKRFKLPSLFLSECNSAVSPRSFTIDPNGYIYKCWEEVDKFPKHLAHVRDEFKPDETFNKWLSFKKIDKKGCTSCKVLPICNNYCTKKHIDDFKNFHCSSWKNNLQKELKRQYLEKMEHPGLYGDF